MRKTGAVTLIPTFLIGDHGLVSPVKLPAISECAGREDSDVEKRPTSQDILTFIRPTIVFEYPNANLSNGSAADMATVRGIAYELKPNSRVSRNSRALLARQNAWIQEFDPPGHAVIPVQAPEPPPSGQSISSNDHQQLRSKTALSPRVDRPIQSSTALIRKYACLVERIAHRMRRRLPRHIEVDDLIQVGMLALLESAKTHCPDRRATLKTYAGIRIRGAMLDFLRELDWVPRSLRRRHRMIERARHQLACKLGKEPTSRKLAASLGMPIATYHRILRDVAASRFERLEDVISGTYGSDDVEPSSDNADPIKDMEREDLASAIAHALALLPETQRVVLQLYYLDGLLLREICDRLSVSEARVSQIRRQAAARMRALILKRANPNSLFLSSSKSEIAA